MKANGRRAWRRWCRSCRKRGEGYGADIGLSADRVAFVRRHRGSDAGPGIPQTPPAQEPRPWSPRSLVGMSQGARKRLSHKLLPSLDRKLVRDLYRDIFRIGERLRPCPGCGSDPSKYMGPGICCDGSGVLPARRQRRTA